MIAGSGQHEDENGCLPILPGDVCIVPPERQHTYPQVNTSLALINLMITPEYLDACAPLLGGGLVPQPGEITPEDLLWREATQAQHMRLASQDLARIQELLGALTAECASTVDDQGVGAGLILQVLGLLHRFGRYSAHPWHAAAHADALLLSAIQFLEEHYAEPITIEDLARYCGYSATYLATKFRQCFGMPPTAYLLQLRLQHACTLLQTTDRSVASIALAVGFRDSRYFSTRFGQTMGTTPSAYRLQHGAGSSTWEALLTETRKREPVPSGSRWPAKKAERNLNTDGDYRTYGGSIGRGESKRAKSNKMLTETHIAP